MRQGNGSAVEAGREDIGGGGGREWSAARVHDQSCPASPSLLPPPPSLENRLQSGYEIASHDTQKGKHTQTNVHKSIKAKSQ